MSVVALIFDEGKLVKAFDEDQFEEEIPKALKFEKKLPGGDLYHHSTYTEFKVWIQPNGDWVWIGPGIPGRTGKGMVALSRQIDALEKYQKKGDFVDSIEKWFENKFETENCELE